MNKILISAAIVLTLIVFADCSYCQTGNFNKIDLTEKILNSETKLTYFNDIGRINRTQNEDIEIKEKSPLLGAAMSLVIPGAGEFYAKSYVKSAIFFAVETGLWTVYAIFQSKGNNKTDEYEKYANQNWDIRKYGQWLVEQGFKESAGINPQEPNLEILRGQINHCEENNFSHTLPQPGEQQYYEVIGKYQNFIVGWSTAGNDITKNNYENYVLTQVQNYMSDRQKANDYFNISSYSLDAVVINHLLSAADAAWSVTIYNKSINVNTNFKFRNVYVYAKNKFVLTPFLNVQAVF